jgi:hypothetical protein
MSKACPVMRSQNYSEQGITALLDQWDAPNPESGGSHTQVALPG